LQLKAAYLLGAEQIREQIEAREQRRLLHEARGGRDVCVDLDEAEPLVSVVVPTLNRGPLLAERALSSALAQTYEHLDVVVVGDDCDEATARAATSTGDPRVRFTNLGQRGRYPADPDHRWMVAGATPLNVGRWLARGAWIVDCDDDDELLPHHVETLLGAARRARAEMVHSIAEMEQPDGTWKEVGSGLIANGEISHGTVLYASALRFIPYSTTSWKLHEPTDWNMWRRMRRIGVRMHFEPVLTYRHHIEARHRLAPEDGRAATPTAD
jgi:glycosyltransferase involved in cell wall biosynthesis